MTAQIFADYVPDEEPLTLTIKITRDFEAEPRRKRETICRLLAALATGLLETLDPNGREVELFRQLADEPAETLFRHELRAMHDVDRSRISQLLVSEADPLTELGLVVEFGPTDDRTVELLEELDAQYGRQ